MPALTIRNLPAETHRALRVRAAEHGRSPEAEIRDLLENAARPEGRIRLGSLLAAIGRDAGITNEDAGITNEDVEAIRAFRDQTPAVPMTFE